MRRREFIKVIVGSAAAWPLAVRAQQGERMRRIGFITPLSADDMEAQNRNAAFLQGLQELGWTVGRNVLIDYRWGGGDNDRNRRNAAEMVALAPDVIVATGNPTMGMLQQVTNNVPIVFVQLADPVGAGFVKSLAQPGGNATGFTVFEYGISGKWLALLKEIAPNVKRALVFRDPNTAAGIGQFASIQTVAPALGVELTPVGLHEPEEIERAVTAFARTPDGGLIVTASGLAIVRRKLVITLAARLRLPAVYPFLLFVRDGGLIYYGPNSIDPYRRAAAYVDRILKGEKAADMPVQAPTKYELAINLKTAKAINLTVPPSVLARADEVIE